MKKQNILKIGIVFTLIFALAVTLTRMYTLDTDIQLAQTFSVPTLPSIPDLAQGDYLQKALSIDGRVIQGTNKAPHPTASTAKMILGLSIMKEKPFDYGEKGETITITPEFYDKYLWYINHNGSTTPVITGEEISQYDALASVFLASSNNLADSLAIWAFGSLEDYKAYATNLIAEMGLANTSIGEDASGYSETTTSTAEDLSVIAAKLLENPVLKEIVSLKAHTVPVAGTITNTNQILGDQLENGAVISGVKTGYIGDISGYNLISSYEMDGHTITEALLGASTRQASFDESKKELLRLSEELTPTVIVEEGAEVGYLETWWNGQHPLTTASEIQVLAVNNPNAPPTTILSETELIIDINGEAHQVALEHADFSREPTFIERFLHLFGWNY